MVSARGRQKKKTLMNEKKESAAEEGMAAPQAPSSGPEASGATGAALLASQLETLRERQLALLRVLQSRNLADADASAAAETAFAQVPELRHLRVAESSQSHTIFVNPGTYYMTPIWYRFDVDRGAWTHWTPYAFAGELHDTFWMPMGTDTVQTGFWKDDKPMRENLEIIECLRRRNQRIGP